MYKSFHIVALYTILYTYYYDSKYIVTRDLYMDFYSVHTSIYLGKYIMYIKDTTRAYCDSDT